MGANNDQRVLYVMEEHILSSYLRPLQEGLHRWHHNEVLVISMVVEKAIWNLITGEKRNKMSKSWMERSDGSHKEFKCSKHGIQVVVKI